MTCNLQRIARELEETALGLTCHAEALLAAKTVLGVTENDRAVLDRFATGATVSMDHVRLQDIAIRIRDVLPELTAWVEAILSNDEASTDEELVEHFKTEGGIAQAEAAALVARRSEFLRGIA